MNGAPKSNFYCHDPMCVRLLREGEVELHRYKLNHDVEELKMSTEDEDDRHPDHR